MWSSPDVVLFHDLLRRGEGTQARPRGDGQRLEGCSVPREATRA